MLLKIRVSEMRYLERRKDELVYAMFHGPHVRMHVQHWVVLQSYLGVVG